MDPSKDAQVHQMLTTAGFTRLSSTLLGEHDKSAVFVRSGIASHPPLRLRCLNTQRETCSRCVNIQPPGLKSSLFIRVC